MRTQTVNVYTFDELPESVQGKVLDYFRQDAFEFEGSEFWESAVAFSDIAPIDIESADYTRAQVSIKWTGDSDLEELEGLRAWKWLENNGWFTWAKKESEGACQLTGCYTDCAFGDAIHAYAETPSRVPTLKQVFYEAAQAWVKSARDDLEYRESDEALKEQIAGNEYEFYEDGTIA